MNSQATPNKLLCATHPQEVIIKACSTLEKHNENNNKLLFCCKCIEAAPVAPNLNLIQLQDLVQTLQQAFASLNISNNKIVHESLKDNNLLQNRIFVSKTETQDKDSTQTTIEVEKNLREVIKEINSFKKTQGSSSLNNIDDSNKMIRQTKITRAEGVLEEEYKAELPKSVIRTPLLFKLINL